MENTFCICRWSNKYYAILFYSVPQIVIIVDKMHKVNDALWVNNGFTSMSQPNSMKLSLPMGVENKSSEQESRNYFLHAIFLDELFYPYFDVNVT